MESSTRQFARPQTCFGATARQDGVPPDKIWHNTTSGYAFTDKMCMTRRPVQAMPGGVGPSGRSFGDAYNATEMMHTGRGYSAPEYATGGSSAYATKFATRHDLQHEFRYNGPSRCGEQAAQRHQAGPGRAVPPTNTNAPMPGSPMTESAVYEPQYGIQQSSK